MYILYTFEKHLHQNIKQLNKVKKISLNLRLVINVKESNEVQEYQYVFFY